VIVRVTAILLLAAAAQAAPPTDPLPYRLWWSFPRDDVSAIEIDDPDLHVSRFASRWEFVRAIQRCDRRRGERLLKQREVDGNGRPLREVRIESLASSGEVRTTTRCVMPLADWRTRLGERLFDRLEDELDAHVSFLLPRRTPGPMPPPPPDHD
jgi:hypothetical protein